MRRFKECGLRLSRAWSENAGPPAWQACLTLACVVFVVAAAVASALLHLRIPDRAAAKEARVPLVAGPVDADDPLPEELKNGCSVSERL
jgi:hypothetical protein